MVVRCDHAQPKVQTIRNSPLTDSRQHSLRLRLPALRPPNDGLRGEGEGWWEVDMKHVLVFLAPFFVQEKAGLGERSGWCDKHHRCGQSLNGLVFAERFGSILPATCCGTARTTRSNVSDDR